MSKDKENYGSAYLYAEDLVSSGEFRTVTVEIEKVIPPNTLTAGNGKKIDKTTLKFKGKEKMLVLCKTNVAMIPFVTGEQVEDATGHKIVLQPRIVEAFGEQVVAIRVMPPLGVPVRRAVGKRLGTKAVFVRQGVKPTEPAKPPEPDKPKEQQDLIEKTENTGE
jgi:hypothetical protein